MGSLLSYSGLTTKIRAMQSRLLTDDQYRELAELKSVPQAVTYLKQQPAYEAITAQKDSLHPPSATRSGLSRSIRIPANANADKRS